jgi:hypothetical protein
LLTHVPLAVAVVPLALITPTRGLEGRYPRPAADQTSKTQRVVPLDVGDGVAMRAAIGFAVRGAAGRAH